MSARKNWTPKRVLSGANAPPGRVTPDSERDTLAQLRDMLSPEAMVLFERVVAERKMLWEQVEYVTGLERARRRERDEALTRVDQLEEELETVTDQYQRLMSEADELDAQLVDAEEEMRKLREENTHLHVQLDKEQPGIDSRM
jgi:chromosome segregation ATPase